MLKAIPSKGRAGKITTLKFIPDAVLFVPESEVIEYKKFYKNKIVGVPDNIKGITKTRNFILNWSDDKYIVQLDDDLRGFFYWQNGAKNKMKDIEWHLQQMFVLIEDFGFHLWGWNVAVDNMLYKPYAPISTLAIIGANIIGIIKTGIRFDERFVVKEDYDFALQHIYADNGVLRFNKYFVRAPHLTNEGGCADYRSHNSEEEAYKLLRKKWGSIVKWTKSRNRIKIMAPLRGI